MTVTLYEYSKREGTPCFMSLQTIVSVFEIEPIVEGTKKCYFVDVLDKAVEEYRQMTAKAVTASSIQVRVSAADKEVLQRKANARNMSLSAYVRSIVKEYAVSLEVDHA